MDAAGMQALWAKMPLAEAVVQVFQFVGNESRLQAIFEATELGAGFQIALHDLHTLAGKPPRGALVRIACQGAQFPALRLQVPEGGSALPPGRPCHKHDAFSIGHFALSPP